jgi:hypothetical protein
MTEPLKEVPFGIDSISKADIFLDNPGKVLLFLVT